MAEIKNSFLRSKMNKDLDDRLIPNGEYRDAQNISVGKSEADDIGALETVLGNKLSTDFNIPFTVTAQTSAPTSVNYIDFSKNFGAAIAPGMVAGTIKYGEDIGIVSSVREGFPIASQTRVTFAANLGVDVAASSTVHFNIEGLEVIGYKSSPSNNCIFVFLADYDGDLQLAPSTANCYIYKFVSTFNTTLLVSGSFLNFNKNNPIIGVSIIEELLFWTDNRNQPRKINFNSAANGTYYTKESDISVAKYNPYQPIDLLNKIIKTTNAGSTGAVLSIADTSGVKKGMLAVSYGNNNFKAINYRYVESVTSTSVTLNTDATGYPVLASGDTIYFLSTTMTGEKITYNFNDGATTWPGDPQYLESKFIRLSYRFEFDDGEYSLMAPFTPITFIPKQKGYFLEGDEDAAYRSTILEFMENGVQNIELLIPFPDVLNQVKPIAGASYKIKSLDILYKESDGLVVKIIDTVSYDELNAVTNLPWTSTTTSNIYKYSYQSRKPFRTLPQTQTVRVYDKVPVKALAQETSGNRVIYGNFLDKYTPPQLLNYIVGVGPKSSVINNDNWAEFPNHSVKQNRNYQVGFVLADKFGRQTDVILSGVKNVSTSSSDGTIYGGSTIYNPYTSTTNLPTRDWLGDSLKIQISSIITSSTNTSGEPGLYGLQVGSGFNVKGANPTFAGNTMTFLNSITPFSRPIIGSYLRGQFEDYIKVISIASNLPIVATTRFDQQGGTNVNLRADILPAGYENIGVGWAVTGLTSSTVTPCLITSVTGLNGANYTFVTNSSIVYGQFVDLTFTSPLAANEYTVTCDGPISQENYSIKNNGSGDQIRYAYDLNPVGWYSYKIVVKQTEQDYYNVYLPGILNGYPKQKTFNGITTNNNLANGGVGFTSILYAGATYTGPAEFIKPGMTVNGAGLTNPLPVVIGVAQNLVNFEVFVDRNVVVAANATLNYLSPSTFAAFPTGEDGKTANVVLINDNINKIPRDLIEVGPQQQQFRSSVQLFPRVENKLIISTPAADSDPKNNRQYYPGTNTDTAISIATANDSNMDFFDLTSDGIINIYQIDSDPLITRLSTSSAIGVTSTNDVNTNMVPFLAIYETEPVDSLLDIYWETPSVGLISDLNEEILNEYTGAVGWNPYDSSLYTEAIVNTGLPSATQVVVGLIPQSSQGIDIPDTSIPVYPDSVVDANGFAYSSVSFEIFQSSGSGIVGDPYVYNIKANAIAGSLQTYLFDPNGRTVTLTFTVTNNADGTQASLPVVISLQNIAPAFLVTPVTVSNTVTGVIATLNGTNGSANVTGRTQQLRWSILPGSNPNNYFSITAGANGSATISKNSTVSGVVGLNSLSIKLEDAFNGTNVATPGSLSLTKVLDVTVEADYIPGYACTYPDPAFSSTGVRNNAPTPLSSINLSIVTAPTRAVQVNDGVYIDPVINGASAIAIINTIITPTSFTLDSAESISDGTALIFHTGQYLSCSQSFTGGPTETLAQTCPAFNAQPVSGAGYNYNPNYFYYSPSLLVDLIPNPADTSYIVKVPQAGSIIYEGTPSLEGGVLFSSLPFPAANNDTVVAPDGFYSISSSNNYGPYRVVMKIENGVVAPGYPQSCGNT